MHTRIHAYIHTYIHTYIYDSTRQACDAPPPAPLSPCNPWSPATLGPEAACSIWEVHSAHDYYVLGYHFQARTQSATPGVRQPWERRPKLYYSMLCYIILYCIILYYSIAYYTGVQQLREWRPQSSQRCNPWSPAIPGDCDPWRLQSLEIVVPAIPGDCNPWSPATLGAEAAK